MKKFRVKNGNATFANVGKNNVLDKKIITIEEDSFLNT